MKKKKNENNIIIFVCLVIVVGLICLVAIFDVKLYEVLKEEKNEVITTNIIDASIKPVARQEKIIINNNTLCLGDVCSNEATLGNYKIEYKDNKYYLNGNEIAINTSINEISLIDNEELSNYILIKLTDNSYVIYNTNTGILNNLN